jgi:hypothetical protein
MAAAGKEKYRKQNQRGKMGKFASIYNVRKTLF